jgi:hypothetical protein
MKEEKNVGEIKKANERNAIEPKGKWRLFERRNIYI